MRSRNGCKERTVSINRITVNGTTHRYEFDGLDGTPSWIGPSKPTYTASEIGALPASQDLVDAMEESGGLVQAVPEGATVGLLRFNATGYLDQDRAPSQKNPSSVRVCYGRNLVSHADAVPGDDVIVDTYAKGIRVRNTTGGARMGAYMSGVGLDAMLWAGRSYTLSAYVEVASGVAVLGVRDRDTKAMLKSVETELSGNLSMTFTAQGSRSHELCFLCTSEVPMTGDVTFEAIQLERGRTETRHVSPGTVVLEVRDVGDAIVDAIPVTMPEKGFVGALTDDTCDELEIDGSGEYTWLSVCDRVIFDGTESWTLVGGGKAVSVNVQGMKRPASQSANFPGYCSHFVPRSYSEVTSGTTAGAGISGNPNASALLFSDGTGEMTVAKWKSWLADNPVVVVFPLSETIYDEGSINPPMLKDGWDLTMPDLDNSTWTSTTTPTSQWRVSDALTEGLWMGIDEIDRRVDALEARPVPSASREPFVGYMTPESFGAMPDSYDQDDDPEGNTDGSSNKYVAWRNYLAFRGDGSTVGCLQIGNVIYLKPGATYYFGVNNIKVQNRSDLTIYGNGATLLFTCSIGSNRTLFGFENCTNVKVYDLNIATNWDTVVTSGVALDYLRNTTDGGISTSYGAVADGTQEWEKMVYLEHNSISQGNTNTKCTYGMSFNEGCDDIVVRGCSISGVGDGLCANDSEGIWFVDNHIHHTYQETIVVRQCKNVVIRGNDLHNHAGDCVIVKAHEEPDLRGIVIAENRIHDPVGYVDGGFAVGGGITVNAEFVENDRPGIVAYPTQGVVISNNTISDCRYGVQVCNVLNCIVANNYASVMMKGNIVNPTWDDGSCAFGLSLQTDWSPKIPTPIANVLFTGNVGSGGAVTFLSWYDASDVPVESVTFSNNMCIASERTKGGQPYYSAKCANMRNSLVIGNKFSGGKRFGEFDGCIVKNNVFEDVKAVPDEWPNSDIYLREGGCVFDGNVVTAKWVYVYCTGPTYVGNNVLDLSDKLIVKMDGGQVITVRSNIKDGMPLVAGDVTVSGDATDYHFVE